VFYQVLKDGRPILINLDHVTAIGLATASTDPDKPCAVGDEPYAMWIGRDPFREPESRGLTEEQYREILRLIPRAGAAAPSTTSPLTTSRALPADPGMTDEERAFVEGAVADAMSDAPLGREGRGELPYWLRGAPQDES
jgi:hypothetical protein